MFSTLFIDLRLVVSIQTNHTCHITSTQLRDYLFSIKVFSSLSPCWFFIHGGKWRKPLRKVSYRRTFGMPDQGQMLDVWGDIQQMSTLRWQWHSYAETSSPQPAGNLEQERYRWIGISARILDHMDRNWRYLLNSTNPVQRNLVHDMVSFWCWRCANSTFWHCKKHAPHLQTKRSLSCRILSS